MFPNGSTVLPCRGYIPRKVSLCFLSVFCSYIYIYIYILIKIPSYSSSISYPHEGSTVLPCRKSYIGGI